MKITAISPPALCLLPLMEASGSTLQKSALNEVSRPAGFWARIVAKIYALIIFRVPVGYQDEQGFHHGVAETSFCALRSSPVQRRSLFKPCLKGRGQTMRASNFNSGGQLVLQWDSSSRPPFRLSPESFSAKSCPRHALALDRHPGMRAKKSRLGVRSNGGVRIKKRSA